MPHLRTNQNIRCYARRIVGGIGAWGGRAAGLLLLRWTMGGVFLAHGVQKFAEWGWTGGVPFFASIGIPFPELAAPLVAGLETVGGVLLLAGLATRATAGILAVVMLVAALTVHLPYGFFSPNGVELVLVLGVCLVVLLLGGSGPWALDGWRASNGSPACEPSRTLAPTVCGASVDPHGPSDNPSIRDWGATRP